MYLENRLDQIQVKLDLRDKAKLGEKMNALFEDLNSQSYKDMLSK
jgi:hypothetical protein